MKQLHFNTEDFLKYVRDNVDNEDGSTVEATIRNGEILTRHFFDYLEEDDIYRYEGNGGEEELAQHEVLKKWATTTWTVEVEETEELPRLFIAICQHDEWDFSWDLVCEANLMEYISKNSGCYVEPFNRGVIDFCEKLQQEIFFTAFTPPDTDDIPSPWIYTSFVHVLCEQDIKAYGGERLAWVKTGGQWTAYSYDDYLEFIDPSFEYKDDEEKCDTLFDYANIVQTII